MKHIQKYFDALKCLKTTWVSEEGIVGSGTDALRNIKSCSGYKSKGKKKQKRIIRTYVLAEVMKGLRVRILLLMALTFTLKQILFSYLFNL